MTSPLPKSYRTSEFFEEDSESEHVSRNEQEEINADAQNVRRAALCSCIDTSHQIPYGFCHCGCGNKAPVSSRTDNGFGWVKGQPKKFIFGHRLVTRHIGDGAGPFKIDGVYCRLLAGTQGMFGIVDDVDFADASEFFWHSRYKKSSHSWYLERSLPMINGRRPKKIGLHQQILSLPKGDQRMPDHINGCGLDNRRKNLRPATKEQNGWNSRKKITNSSGYIGVSLHVCGKWAAQIRVGKRKQHLGLFVTALAAHEAYSAAALEHRGEFARTK